MNNKNDGNNNLFYTENQLISNAEKGLKYLTAIKANNDEDIYVVCHSHIMTDMYKFITQENKINNNTKKLFKTDNIWELRIPNHSKKIRIFRHGYSVANMHKDKSDKFGIDQISEKDAKLSIYGILTALKMSEKINKNKSVLIQENTIIYVSCLIRTWMTAICLFLPILRKNNDNKDITLNLKVGDYLKESSSYLPSYMQDNIPESIKKQMLKIKLFVDYLKLKKKWNNNITISIIFNDKLKLDTSVINKNYIPNNIKPFLKNHSNNKYKFNKYYNEINEVVNNKNINKKNNKINKLNNETNSNLTNSEINEIVNNKNINKKNINKKNNITNNFNNERNSNVTNSESNLSSNNNQVIVEKGFPKPKETDLKKFHKWYEPFSIKIGNNNEKRMSRFIPSLKQSPRKNFRNSLKNIKNN